MSHLQFCRARKLREKIAGVTPVSGFWSKMCEKYSEDTYRQHVTALGVRLFSLLFLRVELAEEVEREDRVQIDDDACQHERQDQLQHRQPHQ